MNQFKFIYIENTNKIQLNIDSRITTLNFFELRILKQNIIAYNPLFKKIRNISICINNIIFKFTSEEFSTFSNSFLLFYNSLLDDYKIKIDSKLLS